MCVMEWVQPNSPGSSEKMSWYLARRDLVALDSGGHDSSLLRSNSLNHFSCHCFMVNLGTWWTWFSSNAFVKPICTGSSGIQVTVTAWATGVFFLNVWGDMWCCFSLPQKWFYCHCIAQYRCSEPSAPWGKEPSLTWRALVITLIPYPQWAVFVFAWITQEEKVFMVSVSLVVTISS